MGALAAVYHSSSFSSSSTSFARRELASLSSPTLRRPSPVPGVRRREYHGERKLTHTHALRVKWQACVGFTVGLEVGSRRSSICLNEACLRAFCEYVRV